MFGIFLLELSSPSYNFVLPHKLHRVSPGQCWTEGDASQKFSDVPRNGPVSGTGTVNLEKVWSLCLDRSCKLSASYNRVPGLSHTHLRMHVLHLLRLSTILQLHWHTHSSLSAVAAANILLMNSLISPEMASVWQCMNTYPPSPSAWSIPQLLLWYQKIAGETEWKFPVYYVTHNFIVFQPHLDFRNYTGKDLQARTALLTDKAFPTSPE